MESLFKEVLKYCSKINKILSKMIQDHPKLHQQADLALYACIQIQKCVSKYAENQGTNTFTSLEFEKPSHQFTNKYRNLDEDGQMSLAIENFHQFKNATYKLERKINVLINEKDTSALRIVKPEKKEERLLRKGEGARKQQMRQQIGMAKHYDTQSKDNHDRQLMHEHDMQLIDENSQEYSESSHLSEVDASILKLTHEILRVVGNNNLAD